MNLRDLKQEIRKIAGGYKVKTNFSSCEFLVEVGNMIIIAKPICLNEDVVYEFMLDTQFLTNGELTYEEAVILKEIMELLINNKKLAISRLKKWKKEEFLEDKRQRKLQSEQMLEMLKKAITNR